MRVRTLSHLLSWLAIAAAVPASAQMLAPPLGVVALAASASLEIDRDLLAIVLSTTRDGPDAATVQSQLKQALDAALVEAKKAVRPGQLEARTGQFSLSPRYSNKGVVSGWLGSAELAIEGRDIPAIAQLTGRITTMTIARVGFQLSREVRERAEAEAAAQAIARFRAQAAGYAKQFGYATYEIREVNVNTSQPVPYAQRQMVQARSEAAMAPEALPVEPGRGTVTVMVNGSVQMK